MEVSEEDVAAAAKRGAKLARVADKDAATSAAETETTLSTGGETPSNGQPPLEGKGKVGEDGKEEEEAEDPLVAKPRNGPYDGDLEYLQDMFQVCMHAPPLTFACMPRP